MVVICVWKEEKTLLQSHLCSDFRFRANNAHSPGSSSVSVDSGLRCSSESALASASGAALRGAAGVGAGAAPPVPSPLANTSSTAPSLGNDGSVDKVISCIIIL